MLRAGVHCVGDEGSLQTAPSRQVCHSPRYALCARRHGDVRCPAVFASPPAMRSRRRQGDVGSTHCIRVRPLHLCSPRKRASPPAMLPALPPAARVPMPERLPAWRPPGLAMPSGRRCRPAGRSCRVAHLPTAEPDSQPSVTNQEIRWHRAIIGAVDAIGVSQRPLDGSIVKSRSDGHDAG